MAAYAHERARATALCDRLNVVERQLAAKSEALLVLQTSSSDRCSRLENDVCIAYGLIHKPEDGDPASSEEALQRIQQALRELQALQNSKVLKVARWMKSKLSSRAK
ncbi:hypothetical protein [Asticcacaulis sp. AND118]|uniref:hypothetical protein n=1 Tax=Asticcacaulis sp. AND118 TaxID=2840468 RepID=UPI001CFF84BF|nr:hypothetical protein [Asticcacaulis sp. AND118]UDF03384.1 hypothetical protein LH365_13225 [Asticcacaulis sp. AND118]